MVYEGKRTNSARRRRTQYNTAPRRRTNTRSTSSSSENRAANRLIACVWILFIVVAAKLLFPAEFESVRSKAVSLISGDADYKAAISSLGDAINGDEKLSDALSKAYSYAFKASGEGETVETSEGAEGLPASTVAEESAYETVEYTSGTSDTVFKDIPLPANVTMDKPESPVEFTAPAEGQISSKFGYRVHPVSGNISFHYGVDIAAEEGSAVNSAADGTVYAVGDSTTYGLYVIIEHDGGVKTLYAHLDSVLVSEGSTVSAGSKVGTVGATGNATSPCLHFEVTVDGVFTDPEYYI